MHKNKGGAALVNLRKKDIAVKSQWVVRSVNDNSLKNLAEFFLPVMGLECWKTNIKRSDITKLVRHSFWREVWLAWAETTFHEPKTQQQVLDQYLWFNSWTHKRNKPFIIKLLFDSNIKYVKQLIHPKTKKVMTWEEFVFVTGVNIDFLTYNGLMLALPQNWKRMLANRQSFGESRSCN